MCFVNTVYFIYMCSRILSLLVYFQTSLINEELSQHLQKETELENQLAARVKEVKSLQSRLTDAVSFIFTAHS